MFVTVILMSAKAYSQGFVNLDFEDATVILAGAPDIIYESSAIPGWSAYFGGGGSGGAGDAIYYDTISLGGSMVALEDNNNVSPKPIQGNYSVFLFGASSVYAPPDEQYSASIGQTATIPTTAESLTYWSSGGALQATFNGQPLDFLVTGSTANYNIYSADVSAYAGQNGQLLFTTPVNDSALLDNIQFSTSPAPEPSAFALTALGGLLLSFRRWRNTSR